MGITISTLAYPEEIKDMLKTQFKSNLIFSVEKGEDYTLFKIDFDQKKELNKLEFLANIIADIVVDHLEKKFINRIIKHKYQEFSVDEQDLIEEMTLEHLNQSLTPDKKLGKILRRDEVVKQIINYLKKNQDLNIEGFVRFRLKNYIEKLNMAVEMSVDDFIIEKEYNEFIDLLRYFVDLQEPRIVKANVVKNKDESFQIFDENGHKINNDYLEGYIAEMFEEDVEYEDLLVSALINVAPAKIILHFHDAETEETIRKIFVEKVETCNGCKFCKDRTDID